MGSYKESVDFLMTDELLNKTIGELDLAVLGRTYRLIRMYLDTPADPFRENGEGRPSLRYRLSEHILCDGPYSTERTLALMIVFEEQMGQSAYMKKVERTLDKVFGIDYEEQEGVYERQLTGE